jgi:hypothetical protein
MARGFADFNGLELKPEWANTFENNTRMMICEA